MNNPAYYFGQMFAVEAEHDTTAKTIFGNITIPAGQTAEQDLESLSGCADGAADHGAVRMPAIDPAPGHQQPQPAYIQRVSQVFENDGTGVAGNLQAVITAILTDAEARAGDDRAIAPSTANFGHLREPILFMANLLRGLNATARRDQRDFQQRNQHGRGSVLRAQRVQLLFAAVPHGTRPARPRVPDLLHADRGQTAPIP